jgi:hypothetical protein
MSGRYSILSMASACLRGTAAAILAGHGYRHAYEARLRRLGGRG